MPHFGKQHRLCLSTLYRWQAKYTEPTFAQVELAEPPANPTLILEVAHTGHRAHHAATHVLCGPVEWSYRDA